MADESPRFDQVTPGGVVAAVAAAGAGAALDLVAPGSGAVASASLQAMLNFVGNGIERRQRRAAEALDEACSASGHEAGELLMLAGKDDRRAELAFRALTAASQSTVESKIRALGRALATGVLAADEAIVDREAYVVDALAKLEPPHVRILEILENPPAPQENGRIYRSVDLAWTPAQVASRYPQAEVVMVALFATLSAIGAVTDIALGTTDYAPTYQVSSFGTLLLSRLREAGLEEV